MKTEERADANSVLVEGWIAFARTRSPAATSAACTPRGKSLKPAGGSVDLACILAGAWSFEGDSLGAGGTAELPAVASPTPPPRFSQAAVRGRLTPGVRRLHDRGDALELLCLTRSPRWRIRF